MLALAGVWALSAAAGWVATGCAAGRVIEGRLEPGGFRALREVLGDSPSVRSLEERLAPVLRRARDRARAAEVAVACERQMPELLDILGLGLSAGLSFDASLELYCANHGTELAREVLSAMRSWQMGMEGRAEALQALSRRVRSASLARFCSAVCEAISFGSPLAPALERQADSIREEQRLATQERMEEVPVRMLVPLGTLVVPAMLLAILGPLLAAALSR